MSLDINVTNRKGGPGCPSRTAQQPWLNGMPEWGEEMPDLRVEYRGRRLGAAEASGLGGEVEVVAVGPDFHDSHVIHAFPSNDDFDAWVAAAGLQDRVSRLLERIASARKRVHDDLDVIRRAQATEQRMRRAIEELAGNTGLAVGSEQFFRRATVDRQDGEAKVFDSAILYADINYGGRWLPIYQDCPNLGWFGFNDVTSSIQGIGEGALFADINYQGRIYWLLTNPLPPSFGIFGIRWLGSFNDLASSVAVYS
jgi:hypothetical protein